jgi:hypothetical protein
MRGRILLVALLSVAPGHSALPPGPPRAPPPLAPSPYAPALASDPFASAATRDNPRPASESLAAARHRAAPRHAAALAPSPYELRLAADPYAGFLTSRPAPALAATRLAVREDVSRAVLAPSPYEPRLPSELAPSPY